MLHVADERVVVVGGGGLGREVISVLHDTPGFRVMGVLDDGPTDEGALRRLGTSRLGGMELLADFDAGTGFVIAVGATRPRQALAARALNTGLEPVTIIHPNASVGYDVRMGRGCVIFPGAVLTANISLGDFVVISAGVLISHDTTIGNTVTINQGAIVADGVGVGHGAFVGAASFIPRGVSVAPGATVRPGESMLRGSSE